MRVLPQVSRNAAVTVPARRGLAVPFAGNLGSMDYRLVGVGIGLMIVLPRIGSGALTPDVAVIELRM